MAWVWVWDPPDNSRSAPKPNLSVASPTNVPVLGSGTVTEPQGGPEPGPPAFAGQQGVVGKQRLADVGSHTHTQKVIPKHMLLDALDSVHWQ